MGYGAEMGRHERAVCRFRMHVPGLVRRERIEEEIPTGADSTFLARRRRANLNTRVGRLVRLPLDAHVRRPRSRRASAHVCPLGSTRLWVGLHCGAFPTPFLFLDTKRMTDRFGFRWGLGRRRGWSVEVNCCRLAGFQVLGSSFALGTSPTPHPSPLTVAHTSLSISVLRQLLRYAHKKVGGGEGKSSPCDFIGPLYLQVRKLDISSFLLRRPPSSLRPSLSHHTSQST